MPATRGTSGAADKGVRIADAIHDLDHDRRPPGLASGSLQAVPQQGTQAITDHLMLGVPARHGPPAGCRRARSAIPARPPSREIGERHSFANARGHERNDDSFRYPVTTCKETRCSSMDEMREQAGQADDDEIDRDDDVEQPVGMIRIRMPAISAINGCSMTM